MKLSFAGLRAWTVVSTLLAMAASVNSISFPIQARQWTPDAGARALSKRVVNMQGDFGNGSVAVSDFGDIRYKTNITLGGAEFEVLIDTGSSDLWVVGDVPQTKNLSVISEVAYGVGAAVGYINTADLIFDDFTISDQAYLHAVPADEYPATLANESLADSVGILGLGPSASSKIFERLGNFSKGDPPLDRIFRQNTSTPNFLSIVLVRESNDTEFGTTSRQAQTGQLTIGEYVPGLEAIENTTRLPALIDQYSGLAQHWTTLLDSNGIIGPNGERIQTKTAVENPTNGSSDQLHVIFDSGFSIPQLPRDIVDAIYGRIPGAEFVTAQNVWKIPCDYEVNVTFIFAGVEFPISPFDLNVIGEIDENGNALYCGNGFQQTASNIASDHSFGALDAILGMGYLRNAYLLINFGDFVDGSNSSVADPFIQILPTTNASAAHLDFVNQRLGGIDTTGSQAPLLPVDQGKHSPAGNSTDKESDSLESAADSDANGEDDKPFYQKTWFIVVVSVGGAIVLALVGFGILAFTRRRRSNVKSEAAFMPQMVGPSAYKPLGEQSALTHPKHDSTWHPEYDEPQYVSGGKYGV